MISAILLCLLVSVTGIDLFVEPIISENYAIVIDAGSTGSRAFVIKISENFTHTSSQSTRNVTSIKAGRAHPGLSSFASNPKDSVDYTVPMLFDALALIPEDHHKKTPLYIKGTAGFRLISDEEQVGIWTTLAEGLRKHKDIPLYINESNFGTISGYMEAYYAVLCSNFIEGTIDGNLNPLNEVAMIGALDMGGSSTQLIFYTHTGKKEKISDSHFWSHSWLNYGVERIRDRVFDYLIENYKSLNNGMVAENENDNNNIIISNPCTFSGYEIAYKDNIILRGTGDGKLCREVINNVIWPNRSSSKCRVDRPCPIDNIIHPSVKHHVFYAMSVYFFALDCIRELGPARLRFWPNPTLQEIEDATNQFCSMNWSQVESNQLSHKYTGPSQLAIRCLEGAYIGTILEKGFGFNRYRRDITFALEVEGSEVEWTLGFALAEINFDEIAHLHNNKIESKINLKQIQQSINNVMIVVNQFVSNGLKILKGSAGLIVSVKNHIISFVLKITTKIRTNINRRLPVE
eukprot:gene9285-12511_t